MTRVQWDQVGQRLYETGVDQGVLYIPNGIGEYDEGFPWSGLTAVTESPSGAESNKQYADNRIYVNLLSIEQFGGTVEAFMYPPEFAQCDGSAMPQPGVAVGQQSRKTFGLCYRTILGNDLLSNDYGYRLHLLYGLLAAPSEKAYSTVNESPELATFSWDVTSTPVTVGTVDSVVYKPTSQLTITSSDVDATVLSALEDLLYGTEGTDPSLPFPADVLAMFAGTITNAFPTAPTYNNGTHTLTIPTVTGITYYVGNDPITSGAHVIAGDTIVKAKANVGYRLTQPSDSDWFFDFS